MAASPQVKNGTLEADIGLEVLDPPRSSVAYAGGPIEFGALEVGVLPEMVRQARPLIEAVLAVDEDSDLLALALDLVPEHGDALFAALALATGQDVARIRKGTLAQFHALAKKVLEVNRDFFVQTLGPHLARARNRQGAHGGGPTASSA